MIRKFCLAACLALFLGACTTVPTAPEEPRERISQEEWGMLQQELETALGDVPEVAVMPVPGGLLLRLPADKGFEPDQSTLSDGLQSLLDRLVTSLGERQEILIDIIGHTDSIGSEMYNLKLSIARAEAVVAYLNRRGIALARLHADGKGEGEPIARNNTPQGRATNRRVEVFLRAAP